MCNYSIILPLRTSVYYTHTVRAILAAAKKVKCTVEIIIVGHIKNCEKIAPEIILIESVNTIAATKRNIGMRIAKGEQILFIDDDVVIEKEAFVLLFSLKNKKVLYMPTLSLTENNFWQKVYNINFFYSYIKPIKSQNAHIAATFTLLLPAAAAKHVGDFKEFLRGEDTNWSIRAKNLGYSLHVLNDVTVKHNPLHCTLIPSLITAFTSGQYAKAAYKDMNPKLAVARFAYLHPIIIFLLLPLIPLYTLFVYRKMYKYWYTFLPVLLCKWSWCIGVLHQSQIKIPQNLPLSFSANNASPAGSIVKLKA